MFKIWSYLGKTREGVPGRGAACKDLEVRENVAGPGNLVKLRPTGESSEGRKGHDKAEEGQGVSSCRTLHAGLGSLIYPESDESHGRV